VTQEYEYSDMTQCAVEKRQGKPQAIAMTAMSPNYIIQMNDLVSLFSGQ